MSRVGGIEKVTPARYDEADQSVNRQPTDSRTSAETASSLPHDDAVSPMVNAARSCVSSIAPLPFHVVTTGAPSRSASASDPGRGVGPDRAAAGDDDRPGGAGQQLRGPLDIVGRRADAAARLALVGFGEGHVGRLGQDVHRQVEQDRAGPPGQHLVPGAMQHEGQLVDPRRLPPLLHDRLEDARVVGDVPSIELLEQAGAAHVRVGRAGEQGDRGRVDVGGGHADDGVRGARGRCS